MTKKKNINSLTIMSVVVIVVIATIWIVIPLVCGNKIKHYKQLFLKCDGQVLYCPEHGDEVTLPLFFYDEIDISEMANVKNFEKVKVYLSDGSEIEATKCLVEDYSDMDMVSNQFFYKKISITFNVPDECEVVACSFEYKDLIEKFDIGNLKIKAFKAGMFRDLFYFDEELIDTQDRPVSGTRIENKLYNSMIVCLNNYNGNIYISKIDLGSDILGVDLTQMKYLGTGSYSYDSIKKLTSFKKEWTLQEISQSGSELKIEKNENSIYILPLGKADSYSDEYRNYYIAPLYYINDESGNSYVWGREGEPMIITPYIYGDGAIEQLQRMIEEEGQ